MNKLYLPSVNEVQQVTNDEHEFELKRSVKLAVKSMRDLLYSCAFFSTG